MSYSDQLAAKLGLKKVGREWHGACPRCRAGIDRFMIFKHGETFFCRRCGFRGSVSHLMAREHGVAYPESRGRYVERRAPNWTLPEWQENAKNIVREAYRRLKQSPEAIEYLSSRGVELETALAYKVGMKPMGAGFFAIVLPHCIRHSGKTLVTAIKLRYVDTAPRRRKKIALRYSNMHGSEETLFGTDVAKGPQEKKALVVTEGEINALAIHTAIGDVADVVSFGSESGVDRLSMIQSIARDYSRVIAIADRVEVAARAADILGGTPHHWENEDASDIAASYGRERLRRALAELIDRKTPMQVICETAALFPDDMVIDFRDPEIASMFQEALTQKAHAKVYRLLYGSDDEGASGIG